MVTFAAVIGANVLRTRFVTKEIFTLMLFGKDSFFGGRKIRQFNYKPIYWDPEKEEMQIKTKQRNAIRNNEKPFTQFEYRREVRKNNRKSYNLRILIIVILLLLMFIFFV